MLQILDFHILQYFYAITVLGNKNLFPQGAKVGQILITAFEYDCFYNNEARLLNTFSHSLICLLASL